MIRIKTKDIKPGTILGEDVINEDNNILINSGSVMDERMIQMLIERGITEIAVRKTSSEGNSYEMKSPSKKQTAENINITTDIAQDQMSATVSIEAKGEDIGSVTSDMIKESMVNTGVVFGYMENNIQELVRKFNSKKLPVNNFPVAKGKTAIPGKQGELSISVPHISKNKDFKTVSAVMYACDIKRIVREKMRVDAGMVVAERLDPQPAQEGMDVCGEAIETEQVESVPVNLGNNIESTDNDTQFRSTVTGVACFIDNTLSVFELCFDAKAEITVSKDKMEARLTIVPPAEKGRQLNTEDIKKLIEEEKISFGIIEAEINGAVESAKNGKYPENVLIAKGKPVINSKNGKVKFLFETEGRLKPKPKEDGTVDYKDIQIIESVEKGRELARLIPPTKGENGYDVFGKEIPYKPGKPANLPTGMNTAPKEDAPSVLVATADGNVRFNGKVVEVSEGFHVKGDVDFATGNIEYPKSVIIKGDIKGGFEVKAGGDIEIHGSVEDAVVQCDGDVLVKCGFIGSGKGIINAKGDVSVSFIRNQEIKSRSNIFILREAIGARLWAKNSIEALGKPISIAGGQVSARNEIKAYSIGNINGTKTEVEVGIDFALLEEQYKTESKLKELDGSLTKVKANLQKLRHVKQLKKMLQPKEDFLLKKLEDMLKKINTQHEALEKRKQMIAHKVLEVEKAKIIIEHAIYPGTVIKIGERNMVVNKEIVGPKTIMSIKGEIKVV